jgi:GAF domain-containing protein
VGRDKTDVVTGGRGFIGDELNALRRVATLVAQGVPAADLFHAVSEEVGRLFGEDFAAVMKFDDDHVTVVGLAKDFDEVTVGTPGDPGDRTPAWTVARPIHHWERSPGASASSRRCRVRSSSTAASGAR